MRLNTYDRPLEWANRDPEGLRSAAKAVATGLTRDDDHASRLLAILKRHDPLDPPGRRASERLLRGRPQALLEAVEILITRPRDVRAVLTRYPYTDEGMIDGFLDRGFP